MVYHQKTLCLLVGAGQTTTRPPRCSRSHPVQKQRRKVKIRQLAAVCQSHEKILAQVLLHRLVPTIATQQKKPSNLNSDKTSKICILLTHLSR